MFRSVLVPSREQRQYRRGHRRVWNVIEVHVQRLQRSLPRRTASHPSPSVTRAPIRSRTSAEADVALNAVAPDAVDAHRPAANGARGQEIGSGRRVAFDEDPRQAR